MADHYDELQKLGVDVYSVSTDTHFTHKAWHSSSETIAKIKYAMIGDPTGALTRNFDNMREDEGPADRATFVVDPQGIIRAIEVTAEGIGRDASDLLRKVKAAQYVASHPGEVCPAKWKEGEATLAPSLDRSARSKSVKHGGAALAQAYSIVGRVNDVPPGNQWRTRAHFIPAP